MSIVVRIQVQGHVNLFPAMQDVLGLGGEARMNYPSRLGGNWEWRMGADALSADFAGRLRELNTLFQR